MTMSPDRQQLDQLLRPVAPPRVLEGVYTDDQHDRMLEIIKRRGPWTTITSQAFKTVDELMATSNAGAADRTHAVTLDDIAIAHFRGRFAQDSVCLYPEIEDCFYNETFLEFARQYWQAEYARPQLMLFNICGPHQSGMNAHLDAVNFRGVRIDNAPVWLQNVMGRSGLFTDHLVKMAQVIAWWYLGENGTFTYWPDGPLAEPRRLDHPLWNKGVVVQNEMMFHRGDPVGRPEERDIPGLKNRSLLGYEASTDEWAITTDGAVIRRYKPEEMRLLVHWNAEVFADRDELERNNDRSQDLSIDTVFDRLLSDLGRRGIQVDDPTDPLHDSDLIRVLTDTYSIAPTKDWVTPAV
jgi:hypothetical protein